MRLDLVMTGRRVIIPATEADVERLKNVRPGDLLPVSIKKPRNGDHHRKTMALIAFVAHNHPGLPDESTGEILPWAGIESLITWLKIRTKHFSGFQVYKNTVYMDLKSISYRELDEAEFAAWSEAAKEIIFSELFPGLQNRERIEQECERWLAWG